MNSSSRAFAVGLGVVAFGMFLAVLWFDATVLDLGILEEDTEPEWTAPYLLRAAVLATAAILGFLALVRQPALPRYGTDSEPTWWARVLVWTATTIAAGFVLVFLADAELFYELSLEDRSVETFSAILAIGASLFSFSLAYYLARSDWRSHRWTVAGAVVLSIVCLLIGVEEISWGQRILDLDTPEGILQLSERDEINVHNMATAFFEISYYFGLFLFFIAAPLLHERTRLFDRASLALFVPTWTSALVVAPAFGFNYVFWNLAFTQVAFWFTLCFLVWHLMRLSRLPNSGACFATAGTLAVFLFAQIAFLVHGDNFVRPWDATEYKELILPLGLVVYALVLNLRLRGLGGLVSACPGQQ